MTSDTPLPAASHLAAGRFEPDPVGVPIAAVLAAGLLLLPFATLRANRIVTGEGLSVLAALPVGAATGTIVLVGAVGTIGLLRLPAAVRLAAAGVLVAGLLLAVGIAPPHLVAPGDRLARVSPASGFWLVLAAALLLALDALTRLRPSPLARIALLGAAIAGVALVFASDHLAGLSVMREYATRAASFWREAAQHGRLAAGSLGVALLVGVPLGILCARVAALRGPVLAALNVVQTIPSIALFALLITPLAFVAANVPGASALGIRGIGAAPAFLALVLYSLLPVVANTVAGLRDVPEAAREAARGCGMTDRQSLVQVEMPLALPAVLAAVRIVLVQNIGLATVAALIGGGGFGVFVFQGIGQTAMDLVLLGVIPTVALCFLASVVLGALIELAAPGRGMPR